MLALYQRDHAPGDAGQTRYSFGVLPSHAFSRLFKLQVEFGHDRIHPDSSVTRTLNKVTVAPMLALGGMSLMDRPEIRLYWTYASWHRGAQEAAVAGSARSDTSTFGAARHGDNFGVPLETWW